ncbi:MAG: hypothetical protein QOG31_1498 [Thermoplasmata archaeon]|nr:hypothetical protein [Thermoplasmata archaeon]
MKRHPALQDLSRDHHVALLHARRLRGEDARMGLPEARRRFFLYHAGILRHHFTEEELALLPVLRDTTLRERFLREHRELEDAAVRLPNESDTFQRNLGERLRAHVRFEEDELFPALQASLAAAEWEALAERANGYRLQHRPGSIGPGAAEQCFL